MIWGRYIFFGSLKSSVSHHVHRGHCIHGHCKMFMDMANAYATVHCPQLKRLKNTCIKSAFVSRYISDANYVPMDASAPWHNLYRTTCTCVRIHYVNYFHSLRLSPSNHTDRIISNYIMPNTLSISTRKFSDETPNDPDVKKWLSEIADDFAAELQQDDISDINSQASESDSSDSDDEGETASKISEFLSSKRVNSDAVQNEMASSEEELQYEDFFGVENEVEDDLEEHDPTLEAPISMHRGDHGVYDLDDLVTLLQSENARDLCVVAVPSHFNYVNHLVIATGRSTRHLKAMAQYVKLLYKRRRAAHDPKSVKIEGENSSHDWLAIDLGNIALHLFLEEARVQYDLESLWTLGEYYDLHAKLSENSALDSYATEVDQLESLSQPMWTIPDNASAPKWVKRQVNSKPTRKHHPIFRGMESVAEWNKVPKEDVKEKET